MRRLQKNVNGVITNFFWEGEVMWDVAFVISNI
jgi:hypothetical protein